MARSSLGFMQLTIICGFSLFYAWYLIAFFGLFMFATATAFIPFVVWLICPIEDQETPAS